MLGWLWIHKSFWIIGSIPAFLQDAHQLIITSSTNKKAPTKRGTFRRTYQRPKMAPTPGRFTWIEWGIKGDPRGYQWDINGYQWILMDINEIAIGFPIWVCLKIVITYITCYTGENDHWAVDGTWRVFPRFSGQALFWNVDAVWWWASRWPWMNFIEFSPQRLIIRFPTKNGDLLTRNQ